MVTRVAISGYYGFGNAGDELVLWSIIEQLRRLQPSISITVFSNDPDQTAADYGVHAVHRYSLHRVAATLRRSDLLISGGGSLLQDITSGRTVPYYLGVIALAQALGVPVFCYSQGIGPLSRRGSRELVRRVLSKVKGITVRDPESALLLREVGVQGPAVEITADPVFGLENAEIGMSAVGEPALLPSGLKGPLIAMSMRPWPARPGWKEETAGAARRCVEQLSGTLVWVAMHPPGDVELAHELAGLAGGDRHVVMTGCSPREWLGLFKNFDLVVGMRLHSLIVAAACGVPFVGLSYDPKVESLLRLFGRETSLRLGEADEAALYAEMMRGWETRAAQLAQNVQIVGEMRRAAAKTAETALSFARKTAGKRGQN